MDKVSIYKMPFFHSKHPQALRGLATLFIIFKSPISHDSVTLGVFFIRLIYVCSFFPWHQTRPLNHRHRGCSNTLNAPWGSKEWGIRSTCVSYEDIFAIMIKCLYLNSSWSEGAIMTCYISSKLNVGEKKMDVFYSEQTSCFQSSNRRDSRW